MLIISKFTYSNLEKLTPIVTAHNMLFLSWDCACKSLAHTLMDVDLSINQKLAAASDNLAAVCRAFIPASALRKLATGKELSNEEINTCADLFIEHVIRDPTRKILNQLINATAEMLTVTDGFLTVKSLSVDDILAGKKMAETTEIERAKACKLFLSRMPELPTDSVVLIERQPNKMNDAFQSVRNSDSTAVSCWLAFHYADLKCDFVDPKLKNKIALDSSLSFTEVKKTVSSGYTARKKQTKLNFKHIADIFNINIKHIPRPFMDDVADSFLQIFAYIQKNKLWLSTPRC